jgi:hypothetical protein
MKQTEKNMKTISNTLEMTETNFTVNKLPLTAINPITWEQLDTQSFGMFRNDTGTWLGTVGNQYAAIQNHELVEIMHNIQDKFNGDIKGGYLKDGSKVYYQLSLNDEFVANDTIKREITLLNSHDGTSSIGFGSSNTVVICENTFYMAMRDLSKFRHTLSASDRLTFAVKEFEQALLLDLGLMDTYKKMSEIQVTKPIISEIIEKLFNVKETTTINDISTRKVNQLKRFNDCLVNELESHGATVWGLFNAVTYYTNHKEFANGKSVENLMIGQGYKKNLTAFNILENFTNSNKKLVHSFA